VTQTPELLPAAQDERVARLLLFGILFGLCALAAVDPRAFWAVNVLAAVLALAFLAGVGRTVKGLLGCPFVRLRLGTFAGSAPALQGEIVLDSKASPLPTRVLLRAFRLTPDLGEEGVWEAERALSFEPAAGGRERVALLRFDIPGLGDGILWRLRVEPFAGDPNGATFEVPRRP
jgi:hypothetical protein